jgi:predicted enzyme related to lactoylglutathione lyase
MTEYAHGTPSWVDLATPEVDASIAFYTGLFGWTVDRGEPYSVFSDDGRRVAGLIAQQNEGQPIAWTTYVSVGSVDAAAEAIGEAGGTVLMAPSEFPFVGRMLLAVDGQGAYFAAWEPAPGAAAAKLNAPVSVCWNELHTSDREAAKAFYAPVFGWAAADEDMGTGEPYTVFSVDGRPVAGAGGRDDEHPHWLTWFAVASADESAARAQELGAQLAFGPFDVPTVGRCAGLADPQGAVFGVLQAETADE